MLPILKYKIIIWSLSQQLNVKHCYFFLLEVFKNKYKLISWWWVVVWGGVGFCFFKFSCFRDRPVPQQSGLVGSHLQYNCISISAGCLLPNKAPVPVLPFKLQSPACPSSCGSRWALRARTAAAPALRPPGRSGQDLPAPPGRETGTDPGRRRQKGAAEVKARARPQDTSHASFSLCPPRMPGALPQRSTAPHTHALHGGRRARPTRRAPAARGSWRPCPGPAPPWFRFESSGAAGGGHGGTAAGRAQTSSPSAARF